MKFCFIIDNKYITKSYTLEEVLEKYECDILEEAEECDCSMNESSNHCEGDCQRFFDSEITGKVQWTGLTDKESIEIYEGDICEVKYYNHSTQDSVIIQEVTFGNGTFELKSKIALGLELEDTRQYVPIYWCYAPNSIKVIGNIYKTPELL